MTLTMAFMTMTLALSLDGLDHDLDHGLDHDLNNLGGLDNGFKILSHDLNHDLEGIDHDL